MIVKSELERQHLIYVQGAGTVPVGAIIPVVNSSPITGGGYPLPLSGTVDDKGWQLCDGAAIPVGNTLTGATPNLSDGRYLRGANISGSTGGSNTFTPTGTNAASNVPATGLSFSGTLTSYSVSVPAHYHGHSLTAANTGVNLAHNHGFRTNWSPANAFIDNYYMATADVENRYLGSTTYSNTNTVIIADSGSLSHTHSVTGSVGFATGSNGDTAFSASGNNTPSGSITGTATAAAQAFTGTATNNEPQYLNVRYIIRVK
jgi:hypothetical protein